MGLEPLDRIRAYILDMRRLSAKLAILLLILALNVPAAGLGQWLCPDGTPCPTCPHAPCISESNPHNDSDYCHRPATDLQAETDCRVCCRYVSAVKDRQLRNTTVDNEPQIVAVLPVSLCIAAAPGTTTQTDDTHWFRSTFYIGSSSPRGPPSFA